MEEIPGGFRCPFEVQGEKLDTIIKVELGDDREKRLKAVTKAFASFHRSPESPGIRFLLPKTLRDKCNSNEELREAIVPYQAEVLAAELDYRLHPLLPHQIHQHPKAFVRAAVQKEPYKAPIALHLATTMERSGFKRQEKTTDIADWIEFMFRDAAAQGAKSPMLYMQGQDNEGAVPLLTITPGSVVLHTDRRESVADATKNRNCFGIVKSPFYPKEFGRYSDNIEIVVSREADFTSLATEVRQRIREKSNTVLQAHGVRIEDVKEDKPNDGVWIPDYIAKPTEKT